MIRKIEKEIEKKFNLCKNKVFPYVDLNMKNGDEITVYAPSLWKYGDKDFSILTDKENVMHFSSLQSVAEWIMGNYC